MHLQNKGWGCVAILWQVMIFMISVHIAVTRVWGRTLVCDNFTQTQSVMLSTPKYQTRKNKKGQQI